MEYKILDTGYLNAMTALSSQTQLNDSDRAGYTGSSIIALDMPNVVQCTFGGQNNINDSPQIGIGDITHIGMNSIENETISITFAYKRDSPPTSGLDVSYAWQLNRLKYTNGIKLIYQSGVGSMTTSLMQLAEYYKGNSTYKFSSGSSNDEDAGTLSTTTPYIPVEVLMVKFTDNPKGDYIKVTMTCRRTN